MSSTTEAGVESDAKEEADGEASEAGAAGAIPTFYFETEKVSVVRILQALMGRATILDMGIEEQSLESVIQRVYSEGSVTRV